MSEIVNSGRAYITAKTAALEPVEITHFVLADIDGLDYTDAVDLDEVMPDVGDIVATLAVSNKGYITPAEIVYSLVMGTSVGDFQFNWVGLKSATGELIAVQYTPRQYKIQTSAGIIGNRLTRNFLLKFDNAQSLTEIVIPAESWQLQHYISESEVINVGSGGDFLTINAALEYITQRYPIYNQSGIRVTINLLAGFVMAEQVIVDAINLKWITITGDDSSTSITRSTLTAEVYIPDSLPGYPAFYCCNGGCLPVIDQLFVMDGSGIASGRIGIYCDNSGSSVTVNSACGVTHADIGFFSNRCAKADIYGADFSEALDKCLIIHNGSTVCAQGVNCSNSGGDGAQVFNATLFCNNGNFSDAASVAIRAIASTVGCEGVLGTGAGLRGLLASSGSSVSAVDSNFQKGGSISSEDIVIANGATIYAKSSIGGLGYGASASSATSNTIYSDGIIFK